jgi:phi13 family phage major tail protein
MATYMAKYPVIAPITAETEGAAPTYGTGMKIGDLISVQATVNNNEAPLYGDDALSEYIAEFRDLDVTLGVTSLPAAAYTAMFGSTVDTAGQDTVAGTIHSNVDDNAAYLGFGFIKTEMIHNERTYWTVWISKVKFAAIGEDVETKGENVTWKTPSLTGKGTKGGDGDWRVLTPYTTEAAAIAALKAKAGIV